MAVFVRHHTVSHLRPSHAQAASAVPPIPYRKRAAADHEADT
jgi:hypothetical protein